MPLTHRWYQPWLALAGLSLIANSAWEWFAISSYAMPIGGGAEFRPTTTSMAVLTQLEQDLAASTGSYAALMRDDVADFNRDRPAEMQALTDRAVTDR